MVYYSKTAQNDLIEIFLGLLTWEKYLEYVCIVDFKPNDKLVFETKQ